MKVIKKFYSWGFKNVALGHILMVLMTFSPKKMYGCLARVAVINKVTVRQSSTVLADFSGFATVTRF